MSKWEVLEQMFIGRDSRTLDEKGRLTIPVRHRPDLALGMVVTRGLDGGLFVFPMSEWERLAEKIKALPITNRAARSFSRFLLGDAADCRLDAQGRVLIPRFLLDNAGIDGEVAVIGQGGRLELWDTARLAEVQSDFENNGDGVASRFAELGI